MWLHVKMIDMTFGLTALHADLLSVRTVDAYTNCYSNASNCLPCSHDRCQSAPWGIPAQELLSWFLALS